MMSANSTASSESPTQKISEVPELVFNECRQDTTDYKQLVAYAQELGELVNLEIHVANRKAKDIASRVASPRAVSSDNVNNGHTRSNTAGVSPGYAHTAGEATTIIRRELDSNSSLSDGRRRVLESALSLIGHFKDTSHPVVNTNYDSDPEDDQVSGQIPSELFLMMLYTTPNCSSSFSLFWPDHIPQEKFEHMCLTLLHGKATGQIACHYEISVLARAVNYFNRWMRVSNSSDLSKALEESKKKYTAAGLRALRRLNVLNSPSLSLLQTLVSGAQLLQLLGDASQAWTLTSFASRVMVALGYHNLNSQALKEHDNSAEIRHCTYYCYYLDKALSMLLVRPPSLPDLNVDPVSLIELKYTEPLKIKMGILLKLSHVQDGVISLLIKGDKLTEAEASSSIPALKSELQDIWKESCEARFHTSDTPEWRHEWDALDFTYHAIATTVLRLNSTSFHDHQIREQCLLHARKALTAISALLNHILDGQRLNMDFLFWTILLYPLTPFFIIFCNVLATSNEQDYHTLTQIMTALSRIKDNNSFVFALYGLLSQFMDLCGQLEAFVENNTTTTDVLNSVSHSPERYRSFQPQYEESISYGPQSRNFWDMHNLNEGTEGGLSMADEEYTGGLGQLRPSMWDDNLICTRLQLSCPGYQQRFRWSTKYEVLMKGRTSSQRNFRSASSTPVTPAADFNSAEADTSSGINYEATENLPDNEELHWGTIPSLDEIDLDGLGTLFPRSLGAESPVSSLQDQQSTGLAAAIDRLDHADLANHVEMLTTSFAAPSTNSTLELRRDSTWNQTPPTRPLVSLESSLVEYYFQHVATIYSSFDGSMNPFRTMVGRVWASSQVLTWTLQSMAAACLARDFPHLKSQGVALRRQALNAIEDEAITGRTTEMSLLSLIMLGQSASWHLQADVGLSQYRLAKKIMASGQRRNNMTEDFSSPGRNSVFFQQSLHYWKMLLSFVTPLDDPACPLGEPQGLSLPLQMIPHPWAIIAPDLMERIHEVGRLVYKHRRMTMGSKFWRRTDFAILQDLIQDVGPIEAYLLNYQLPAQEDIVDPRDDTTPVSHFLSVAQAYRLVALLQIYRIFPDILDKRLTSETPAPAFEGLPKPSSNSAEQWMQHLAMHTVRILRKVPFESHTRSIQAFLLVALSSELRSPMIPDDINNVTNEMLEITEARKFIRGRLEVFRYVFAPQPAQRKLDIVLKAWEQLDRGLPNVYWMDVMIENGWEILFC
ncbi:uncharacterized protein KD926_003842 [Aspergillus affinis]|uniref:uncharacterized protein n=1 Tax=Aspergillus affinis TaxID=1070780 RepID=UPI0022FEBE1E|nr:uncharacterized protein KD926_003842 [Aspergillus affinis]KAI9043312.1 hypothetical protein KD926_003842 [Aspergillus affinis]